MIPVYLADMKSLQKSDASIYDQFLQGNWVVNKNPYVPFCSIGADHGLEHNNCAMKVSGGLVGITLNPRTKFFLISPELARLAGEAQQMAGVLPNTCIHHHDLSTAILERHERNIESLLQHSDHSLIPLLRIVRIYSISSQKLSCQIKSKMTFVDKVK